MPRERRTSLKEAIALGRGPKPRRLDALAGVDFDVAAGEFLGVVGQNGSGKSSLLRVLAGIYLPDRGRIEVNGTMAPFIEMGIGFRGDLTAAENVMLNGTMLGSTRREMRGRLPGVLEFAGLEEFADVRMKNFSSGMTVRLAFATALCVEADIMLVDEVLAVGDEAFQRKCFKEFERMRSEGRTVLFVSHDMDAVERLCDRALLLEGGRIRAEGPPGEIAALHRAASDPDGQVHAGRVRVGDAPSPSPPPTRRRESLGRLGRLAVAFARADLQVHYQGSVLGYLWAVLRPLSLFAVLLVVFSKATNLSAGVENYPVYLLTAIVLWTFFTECTSMGAVSLVSAQGALRKLRFPHLAVPAGVVLKSLFNLGVNLLVAASLFAIAGVPPRLTWLELPLLLLLLAMLASGLAMLLSVLYVRFRDVREAWTVVQGLLFFASPIIFVSARYPESLEDELALSPLAAIFTEMRHALIDPSAPSAAASVGGPAMLVVPLAIVIASFAIGLWAFWRESPRVAERI